MVNLVYQKTDPVIIVGPKFSSFFICYQIKLNQIKVVFIEYFPRFVNLLKKTIASKYVILNVCFRILVCVHVRVLICARVCVHGHVHVNFYTLLVDCTNSGHWQDGAHSRVCTSLTRRPWAVSSN